MSERHIRNQGYENFRQGGFFGGNGDPFAHYRDGGRGAWHRQDNVPTEREGYLNFHGNIYGPHESPHGHGHRDRSYTHRYSHGHAESEAQQEHGGRRGRHHRSSEEGEHQYGHHNRYHAERHEGGGRHRRHGYEGNNPADHSYEKQPHGGLAPIDGRGHQLRSDAASAFRNAQRESGNSLHVISAYRSAERQAQLYRELHGIRPVARPGHSAHQSGLAVDLHGYGSGQAIAALHRNGFYQTVPGDPNHFTYVGRS